MRRLVAYLQCDWARPPVQELREYLGTTLPTYMIPSAFVAVPDIPMTKAGKTDRATLAVLADDAREVGEARGFVPVPFGNSATGVDVRLCPPWDR